MSRAIITLHLPSHRDRALQIESNTREAEEAYDANIGGYLRFLQEQAEQQDFVVKTDTREHPAIFSIDEQDHAAKTAAHGWLEEQPDIWNWIP